MMKCSILCYERIGLCRGQLAPDHQSQSGIEQDLIGDAGPMQQGTAQPHGAHMADFPRLANPWPSRITPPLHSNRPAKGMPWRFFHANAASSRNGRRKMPKLKTKSSAKKRFRFTASGKIKAGQAGK